jgi:hypothetical protein
MASTDRQQQASVARRWRVPTTSMRWIAQRVDRHKAVAHDRDQGQRLIEGDVVLGIRILSIH